MGCRFTTRLIGELAASGAVQLQTGPFGSQLHKEDYVASGTPVIPTEAIGRGRIRAEVELPMVSSSKAAELARHRLKVGDILFARRGIQATGLAACIDRSFDGALCGTGAILLRTDPELIDSQFLAAFLATDEAFNWLRANAVGAVMPNLNTGIISGLAIPIPAIGVQRELGQFVSALDDHIDNLRATNATLEAIAQALFKSWFVDFDPVHAKAEGRAPAGMDAATAALFPSEFEDSELGPIPKGWRVTSLDAIADYLNGLALQRYPSESNEEFLPVIKIAQLHAGNTRGADKASAHLKPEYVVHDGDVLFSWSGSLEVEVWCGGLGALNQHLFKVTSNKVPKWYYYFATRQHLRHFRGIAANKATTMGHIQRRHLTEAQMAVPPSDVLAALSKFIGPLFDDRVNNALRARSLEDLRDTLLPRLISGKLRLPEARELVEIDA